MTIPCAIVIAAPIMISEITCAFGQANALRQCTDKAVERFATQPDSARDVAQAALGACEKEENSRFHDNLEARHVFENLVIPQIMAQIMEIRSARANHQ